MAHYVRKGTEVCVVNAGRRQHALRPREQDIGRCGVLLDNGARIGRDAGWDVYDVQLDHGPEISVYGFNLVKRGFRDRARAQAARRARR